MSAGARRRQRGFSLLEIAVAVAVLGMVLGAVLVPVATQIDAGRLRDTERDLAAIQEALQGFALAADPAVVRLPCPDTDGDGLEDAPCDGIEGNVPWATLGVAARDAWGRVYRYRADDAYTAGAGIGPGGVQTTIDLVVRERRPPDPPPPLTSTDAGDGVLAVIFSCGQNGIPDDDNDADGTPNTAAVCTNPGTPDRFYTQDLLTQDAFDDRLVWISKYRLINRLVSAERWP